VKAPIHVPRCRVLDDSHPRRRVPHPRGSGKSGDGGGSDGMEMVAVVVVAMAMVVEVITAPMDWR